MVPISHQNNGKRIPAPPPLKVVTNSSHQALPVTLTEEISTVYAIK